MYCNRIHQYVTFVIISVSLMQINHVSHYPKEINPNPIPGPDRLNMREKIRPLVYSIIWFIFKQFQGILPDFFLKINTVTEQFNRKMRLKTKKRTELSLFMIEGKGGIFTRAIESLKIGGLIPAFLIF